MYRYRPHDPPPTPADHNLTASQSGPRISLIDSSARCNGVHVHDPLPAVQPLIAARPPRTGANHGGQAEGGGGGSAEGDGGSAGSGSGPGASNQPPRTGPATTSASGPVTRSHSSARQPAQGGGQTAVGGGQLRSHGAEGPRTVSSASGADGPASPTVDSSSSGLGADGEVRSGDDDWGDAGDGSSSHSLVRDDGDSDPLMDEALSEGLLARQLLHALQTVPGMTEDLGLQSPPTWMKPLTREAFAKSFRPM